MRLWVTPGLQMRNQEKSKEEENTQHYSFSAFAKYCRNIDAALQGTKLFPHGISVLLYSFDYNYWAMKEVR